MDGGWSELLQPVDACGALNLSVSVQKKPLLSPSVPSPDIVVQSGVSGYKLKCNV